MKKEFDEKTIKKEANNSIKMALDMRNKAMKTFNILCKELDASPGDKTGIIKDMEKACKMVVSSSDMFWRVVNNEIIEVEEG